MFFLFSTNECYQAFCSEIIIKQVQDMNLFHFFHCCLLTDWHSFYLIIRFLHINVTAFLYFLFDILHFEVFVKYCFLLLTKSKDPNTNVPRLPGGRTAEVSWSEIGLVKHTGCWPWWKQPGNKSYQNRDYRKKLLRAEAMKIFVEDEISYHSTIAKCLKFCK